MHRILVRGYDGFGGYTAKEDHLSSFFKDMMASHAFRDIALIPIAPTWLNGHTGTERISKRLDKFIISESLFNGLSGIFQ